MEEETTETTNSTFNWINTWLFDTFGFVIPDFAFWIAIGTIIFAILAMVAWGFIKEMKKK
ncbi:MAG: hypothetical protein FWE41_04330 [Coriobacteriia bacterium]|nr:hypothetical protein [Coriobacteriia bacterium]MCL2749850.1 hypothetical protein [Coriobacteriia bacterium]